MPSESYGVEKLGKPDRVLPEVVGCDQCLQDIANECLLLDPYERQAGLRKQDPSQEGFDPKHP